MRSESEVNQAIDKYANMVKRICLVNLKNQQDTEDVFQEVFIKYALKSPDFTSAEHEKAWLIRVTLNACRDLIKSFFRSKTVGIDQLLEQAAPQIEKDYDLMKAVLELPRKYREVIYLHYYEEYKAADIGKILNMKVNTVYSNLSRGRKMLRESLGDQGDV